VSEEWRTIEGWEGWYEVSNLGRVRSLDRTIRQLNRWGSYNHRFQKGMVLKPGLDSYGYPQVSLHYNGYSERPLVHHLVLKTFGRARRAREEADHKNGNRRDNRLRNLRWVIKPDNGRNRHHVRNKTGFIGVSINPRPNSPNPYWAAARDKHGKKVFLGMHPSAEAASAAYLAYRETQYSHA
jgi:hypothetical protein